MPSTQSLRIATLGNIALITMACGPQSALPGDGVDDVAMGQTELNPADFRLRRKGNFLIDNLGRQTFLRGFNYSGLEYGMKPNQGGGPSERDFVDMRHFGANVVRLAFAWSYFEVKPNVWDYGYFRDVMDPVVRWAGKAGLRVILEAHHYHWSPCTGGNGAPAWVCGDTPYGPGQENVDRALHEFWSSQPFQGGRPLLDHYDEMVRRVAEYYRNWPQVVGFDFMNEPADRKNFTYFYRDSVQPFYERMIRAARESGFTGLAVVEPAVFRSAGWPSGLTPMPDNDVLYSPHLYSGTSGQPDATYSGDPEVTRLDYEQAVDEARAMDAPLWVGEYGGVTDGPQRRWTELAIAHQIEEQNSRMVGGAVWVYNPRDNPFSLVDAHGHPKGDTVNIINSVYAKSIAGTLTEQIVDTRGKRAIITYRPSAPLSSHPSVIHLPWPGAAGHSLKVNTSAGDRILVDLNRSEVQVWASDVVDEHWVEILW